MIIVWLFSSKTLLKKKQQAVGTSGPRLLVCKLDSLLPSVLLPLCFLLSNTEPLSFLWVSSSLFSWLVSLSLPLDLTPLLVVVVWMAPCLSEPMVGCELAPCLCETRQWLRGFLSALDYFRNLDALFNAFHPWEESGAHRSIAISLILVARHLAPITMVICQTSQFRSWL